ncbi:hypothetical protein WJX81_000565 [Elliptochloris bilobata]|uniref:EGF-like domain-containing protein n=1 Tax=Elliptochloris bilobata TaxID=381761 RepID=A0AAW1S3G9_9CHLO
MPRLSDNVSLVLMTSIALGTLGGVILTSGARKVAPHERARPEAESAWAGPSRHCLAGSSYRMLGCGRAHLWQAFAALGTLASLASASQWVVETNSFRIREPASAAGDYDAAIGDFGVPLYGGTLVGQVVYVQGNAKGCSLFEKRLPATELPTILLVDRGDCYFIEKAYNAEKAGAKAIIVTDYKDERLLTMAAPEDRPEIAKLKDDITIPTALVQLSVGQKLKDALAGGGKANVVVELDWKESVLHDSERVDWELWTSTNDGCGSSCDRQSIFKVQMRDAAVELQKNGYTTFAPHFMLRKCSYDKDSAECRNNCIHHGRYCAVDSISETYSSKFKPRQVVEENKRQLCVFQEAEQAQAAGLDAAAIETCMADSAEDKDHPLLEADNKAQGDDSWSMTGKKILLLPTVVINGNQYRGRLDVPAVTRALCAGFSETTEPSVCLAGGLEVNECLGESHGCWARGNTSACVDTFRGYLCQCPDGWRGDGVDCQDIDECAEGTASCDQICINEPGSYSCKCREGFQLFGGHAKMGVCFPMDRCRESNGGCEQTCNSQNGEALCSCKDGLRLAKDDKACEDIDECAEGSAKCEHGCRNLDPRTTGLPYVCTCPDGLAMDPADQYRCIKQDAFYAALGAAGGPGGKVGAGTIVGITLAAALIAAAVGLAVHKLRMRHVMQSEIRSIMSQYMPLEGNNLDDALLPGSSPRIKSSAALAKQPSAPPATEEC